MPDVFTKSKRSEVVSRIRSRGNKDTELALAKLLRAHGITGWRRQVRVAVEGRESRVEGQPKTRRPSPRPSSQRGEGVRVRPDFVFPKLRLAIFVDGCFWHGCPEHATRPKNNAAFWRAKLAGNKRRDALVTRALRRAGWRVVRIWEHEMTRWKAEAGMNRTQTGRGIPRVVRRIQAGQG